RGRRRPAAPRRAGSSATEGPKKAARAVTAGGAHAYGPRMALDRYRRIARLWNWLPAFRAVAEYESVQAAGTALALSPSALSRAVRLIEDELGEPLFVRAPSGLTLTARGQALLTATRDAMRGVDDALGAPREALAMR